MQTRRITNRRAVIAVIVLLAAAAALLSAFLIVRYNRTHFTVEKWNAYEWNDRQLLVKSFLRQYDLTQMTRDDIVALLGEETYEYYNRQYVIPNDTPDNLVYDFGEVKGRFGGGRNITLIIEFKQNGNVSHYELKTYSQ
jgi:hypothetical protein